MVSGFNIITKMTVIQDLIIFAMSKKRTCWF